MKIFKELEEFGFFDWLDKEHNLKDTDMKPEYLDELPLIDIHRTVCNSMVFRWFREKYELHSYIQSDFSWNISGGIWDLNGYENSRYDWDSISFNNYEEAELDCIIKLIEIVKLK